MQLFIKILQENRKTISIDVPTTDTIDFIKAIVQDKEGIPPQHQRLVFAGKELDNWKTVREYNIGKEATLYLISRNRGGALRLRY